MEQLAKDQIIKKAYQTGLTAPVDVVPDPTEWGMTQWKENLLTFFGCATDNLVSKTGGNESMRPEILSAMREGFKKLVAAQPYVEVPLNPMETPPREQALRIIDLVFKELPLNPHHCTH